MRILLIVNIILINSFLSTGQSDYLNYTHNGYIFKTDINTIINYFQIDADSIDYYAEELQKLNKDDGFHSDSIIQIGFVTLSFYDIIRIFDNNHSFVQIKSADNNTLIKYKVKTVKKKYPSNGIGETSKTFLIIIDKKRKIEVVRAVISTSLAC